MPDPKEPHDSTLPRPELNPLLNPILASHMGRWAEVYFTNPPEKREEAILQLLRELESNGGSEPEPIRAITEQTRQEVTQQETGISEASSAPQEAEGLSVCASCGHKNGSFQWFCGMCGAPLSVAEASIGETFHSPTPSTHGGSERSPDFVSPGVREIITEKVDLYPPPPVANSSSAQRELEWLRSRNDLPSFQLESEPVPDRRRLYVGAVLALLLAALLYLGWRGTAGSIGAATPSSSPPATPAPQPTPAPQSAPASSATGDTNQLQETHPAANLQPASTKTPATVSSTAPPPAESGTEELAIAQKYLTGRQGESRDSSEAAKWLWKAIAKQNMAATLLLSDLYLRGDGVPRSCDQARLLLDAAARKGKAEAAERLRHLQAFGCE